MKTNKEHSERRPDDWLKLEEMQAGLTVNWDETKEAIWAAMEAQLDVEPAGGKVIRMPASFLRWAVAAVILVLLGTTAFMRFYTQTYQVPAGEHQLVLLPDHSKVTLNAESSIQFHPYWWAFQRELQFEGEAYFEVEKGSRFEVHSANGLTGVLGTSFNIYAREQEYAVTCLSGRVWVNRPDLSNELVLLPNQRAERDNGGWKQSSVEPDQVIGWTSNQFVFTAESIYRVFQEIERQYNVEIKVADTLNLSYSGNFQHASQAIDVIAYVCRPFNLNFIEEKPGQFRIEKND